AFQAARGVTEAELAAAAVLASLADDTPEGKSIVALGVGKLGERCRDLPPGAEFVPFTAQTRMSGVDAAGRSIRKGASDAIARHVGGALPPEVKAQVDA